MTDSTAIKLDKIILVLIKGVIFLLPLFFLPWTSEYFEFNKQFLLWFTMPIVALLWLLKAVASGQLKIKINPLNLPILIFLFLTAASSIFGLDKFSSFFGHFGIFSDSWLGLLSLVIFYFLIINTKVAESAENIIGLLKIFLYSSAIAAVLSLMAMVIPPKINLAEVFLGHELPKEASLDYNQSWDITKETLKKNPALGSGPGTFSQDFSLFRPVELNSSALWQIRFDKSRSRFLEILATGGLLGFLSYFLIICLGFYLDIVLIRKYLFVRAAGETAYAKGEEHNLVYVLFTVFILIFFSQIFFPTNTVLNFIFWFILALLISFWQRHDKLLFKEKIIDLHKTVLFYRLSILVLFVLSVGVFALLAFEVKFFAADIIAARGANREASLIMAVKLNPYRYNYRISLAKLYLSQAKAESLKPDGQGNNSMIQLNITKAIETGRKAIEMAPSSVLPYETLGMIYRDIRPLTLGSEAWAVKYFNEAFAFEPTNPVLATELAKAYLNNNDLVNAEKYFNRALELKGDYYEAKFSLAKTYLKGKKDSQALILLNELAREVYDPEVYYELGRFYYNHGEIDKAIDRFKLALSLSPKHSNSLYSLAVAYEAKNDFKEALKYYRQALELSPGNKELENKIKELSK
ncbi:MAG: tetratricopeptide repeat protein [bacterium]|nr:tetratricopeptide repeat protein [bacterium]